MTEVSFYHLQRTPLERALPKLLEKVLESGYRALVMAGSGERVEALNAALWTYEQRSFLPHGGPDDGHAAHQPIYLTAAHENPNGATVLVLVDGVDHGRIGEYERCLDIFDGNDPEALDAARARWRARTAEGYAVTYWQQSPGGGWERQG